MPNSDVALNVQEIHDLNAQMQSIGDLSQELSSHKALYNSAVTRNAERRVQLVSTYGEEEIDAYGLEELENFFNDANPKFEQINHAMEELATNIRVLEPARNSSP